MPLIDDATGEDGPVLRAVRRWLDQFVVAMQLCPFAAAPLAGGRVRLAVTHADTPDALAGALLDEMARLDADAAIETTLLIHPQVLGSFVAYNQFLDVADALLTRTGREGVYQVASFHPDYRFEGMAPDAAENFTNRSPYPMLHLLRENSISRVVDAGIDTDAVPERNVAHMNRLGSAELRRLLAACLED